VAETALSIAREKAAAHGLDAGFAVCDALHLERWGRAFETVLDCGLFHSFDGDERRAYAASLSSATARGGRLYLLCFSDVGPDPGPHAVGRDELSAAFSRGVAWRVVSIDADRVEAQFRPRGAPA
jgi:hypothetical protein